MRRMMHTFNRVAGMLNCLPELRTVKFNMGC
jgi:hypothetical protein